MIVETSMSSLRLLLLDENPLQLLPRNAFASLPGLVFLSLKNCSIKKVEKGALDGELVNLRFLNLEDNEFDSLDLSVFDSADLINLFLLSLTSQYLKLVTNSRSSASDTFLAKCLNQGFLKVDLHSLLDFSLLDSMSKKGKLELIRM
jgi:hypothetical protein